MANDTTEQVGVIYARYSSSGRKYRQCKLIIA